MKKGFAYVSIVIILFSTLAVAVVGYFALTTKRHNIKKSDLPFDYPVVRAKEAVAHPEKYNDQNVCLYGNYKSSFEYSDLEGVWPDFASPSKAIFDPMCYGTDSNQCKSWVTVCGKFSNHPGSFGHLGGWDYGISETLTPTKIEELSMPKVRTDWYGFNQQNKDFINNPPASPQEATARCSAYTTPVQKNSCFGTFAEGFNDPKLCEQTDVSFDPVTTTDPKITLTGKRAAILCIQEVAVAHGMYDCRYHENQYFQDRCYFVMATNPKLYRLTKDCSPINDTSVRAICQEIVSGAREYTDILGS